MPRVFGMTWNYLNLDTRGEVASCLGMTGPRGMIKIISQLKFDSFAIIESS
jgi:hypothetical protein